jgi:hypothetical protein
MLFLRFLTLLRFHGVAIKEKKNKKIKKSMFVGTFAFQMARH